MRRDPTQFRERFKQWKNGLPTYKNGRPISFQEVVYDTSNQQYYDIMERVAEQNNAEWNRIRTEEGAPTLSKDEEYLRILNDNSYNYKGYYSKYPKGDGNAIDHWNDEFKTVYHPTFSNQSTYSGKKSQYNPQGVLGGRWDGDRYVPAWGQKLPKYRDGKDVVIRTSGGAVMPYIGPIYTSEESRKAAEPIERIANFIPIVGTIQDIKEAIDGNTSKIPSALIGIVGDLALPGLFKGIKAVRAAKSLMKNTPKIIDKYKYYNEAQKATKNSIFSGTYQGVGLYQDILDDASYISPKQ